MLRFYAPNSDFYSEIQELTQNFWGKNWRLGALIQSQRLNTFLFHPFYHLRYSQNLHSLNNVSVGFPISFMQQTSRIPQHISAFYMLFKCRRRTARWKVGRVIEQRAALSWAAARLLDARSSGRPTAGQAAAAPPHLAYCLLAIHGAAATLPVLSVHSDQSPKYVTWSSYIGSWKVKSVKLNSLSS